MNSQNWIKLIWGVLGAVIGAIGSFFGFNI